MSSTPDLKKGDECKCEACGETFYVAWSTKEARQEQKDNGWGDLSDSDTMIVCDDCYKKIMVR